ncbi:hypothetical protein [Desulfobacula sp.]
MSAELTCPVCHFEHIPKDSESCPQCDSDLVCFRLLEALPDFPEGSLVDLSKDVQSAGQETSGSETDEMTESKAPWFLIILNMIILLTIACLLGYTAHHFSVIQNMVQKLDTDMVRMQTILNKNPKMVIKTLEAGTKQMDQLKKRVEELAVTAKNHETRLSRSTPDKMTISKVSTEKTDSSRTMDKIEAPCFNSYRATDKDTLWTIARDLYGSGIFYPVLMEHNPDIRVYHISSKDTLRYLCDKAQAAGVYKAITGTKQKKRYWNYTVRPGDTRKTIIKRYCMNKQDCLVEDKPLKPGMTIGIFLE